MRTTQNSKCFEHKGKRGFIAKGNVYMLCSDDCGPNGRAEIWCRKCCRKDITKTSPWSTSTSFGSTTARSSTSSIQPTISTAASSPASTHSVLSIIIGVAIGAAFVLIILGIIYYLSKAFKCKICKKENNHHVQESRAPDQLPLSTQCVGDGDDGQKGSQTNDSLLPGHGQAVIVIADEGPDSEPLYGS